MQVCKNGQVFQDSAFMQALACFTLLVMLSSYPFVAVSAVKTNRVVALCNSQVC